MPYHLAILHRQVLDGRNGDRGKGEGGREKQGSKNEPSRAVQGRGDIASKQQGSPFIILGKFKYMATSRL